MSLENYPYDRSGNDPNRGAPTAREVRLQESRRYFTRKSAEAMLFLDPGITGAGMAAQQIIAGSSSPAAARRALYSTAGGQGFLDAAMMARRGGMLGYGDPVNYAANIQGGITGGGFRTSVGGFADDGRPVHSSPSLTSGQGAIAERVSLNYMKGLKTDLYGQGNTDPSKLHGFDMEEASGVFNVLARRGVVGHAAHIEKNASIGDRLGAARESAIHPLVKDALAKVKLGGGSESEQEANFQKAIDSQQNAMVQKEMQAIDDSPDAVVINSDGRKKVSRLVESVIEGMASLSDVYGELTAPQLHRKLEEISGQRITNRSQAGQAQQMVERMRGAAIISDIDPKAYMQFSGDLQAMLSGQVAQAGGFDARTKTMNKRVTAVMHEGMMTDSAISAKLAGANVQRARDAGLTVGEAPTLDEIYADKAEGRLNFLSDYKGVTMAMGKVDTLTGQARKDAKALLEEFQGTTDPNRRQEIESEMQGIWAGAYSRPGQRVDFDAVLESRSAQQMITSAYDTPQKARMMEDMAAQGRANAININPMIKQLEAMGVSGKDSVGLGETIRKDLGLGGLLDLKGAKSHKERLNKLGDAGIEGAAAEKLLGQLFDENGKAKAGFDGVSAFLTSADWGGGMSTYERKNIAQTKLEMMEAGSSRTRLGGGKDGVSLQGIFSAMASGTSKGISDPESMALAIGAMADAEIGIDGISVKDKSATGLNFGGGLNKDDLDKLAGIHGKPLDLYKKMINPKTKKKFKNQDELIKATEGNPQLILDAIQTLQGGEYANLNLKGGAHSMSAIDQELLEKLNEDGRLDEKMKKGAGAKFLADSMGLGKEDKKKMTLDAADGGAFSTAMLEASGLTITGGGVRGWWNDEEKGHKGGDGLGRIMGLSKAIAGANKGQMSNLSALNEDGSVLEKMQSQYDIFAAAKKAAGGDGTGLVTMKGKDGEETATLNELMKGLKLSMEKLKEGTAIEKGAQFVNEMIVTNVRVEGTFDPDAGE
tara:strand:- start:3227 stop:6202 length:2976 start_codon:yes stop_codon:yes gene_type:complete